jgi:hypothetical protein
MTTSPVSLPFAVPLLTLVGTVGGCGSSSDARALDAGIDASAFVGADAGCPRGLSGCPTTPEDTGAGPTADGPSDAQSGGVEASAADGATGGSTQDSGPPLGETGSNWYVAKGAPGTRTSTCTAAGTTWASAWGEMDQINWSCVQPGDTVWLAGGTYTRGFAASASGTASKPIYVARVLSTDTLATSAAGWSAAFDSQVLVTNTSANNGGAGCNPGDVLCFNRSTLGNYTYWDGRVDSGIKLQTSNIAGLSPTNNTAIGQAAVDVGTASGAPGTASNHDITFDSVDFAGPASATVYTHMSYDAAAQVLNVTGNVLFTNCRFHGGNENVNISGSTGVVFDHCKFYDNIAGSGSAGHGNQVQYAGNQDITFRYGEWWNWSVEGIMVWTPSGALYVYGNVFHDADNTGYPSVIQANDTTAGPLYFYNNTIANVGGYCVFRPASSGGWASGSGARNNLYWKSDVCVQSAPNSDYDACYDDLAAANQSTLGISETMTVPQAEAHACAVPASPFVNESAADFHLTANTLAGESLGVPYEVDKDGNVRSTWTRGAYEFHP